MIVSERQFLYLLRIFTYLWQSWHWSGKPVSRLPIAGYNLDIHICVCVCVCVLLWSWWASSESTFQHGWKTPPLVFVSQNRTALPSLSCGPRRRHQSSTRVLPPVFQYIQNSGYHPLFIAITSMEKKKQLRVRVVKWLGFGCRWKLSERKLGNLNSPKGTSDLLGLHQCKRDSHMQLFVYFWVMKATAQTHRRPTAGPLWPHLGYYGSVQSLYRAV